MRQPSAYIKVAAWPISRASLRRMFCVCERSIGIAKHPQSQRPIGQIDYPNVLTKTHRQRTMLGRIVERNRPIEVCSASAMSPCVQQGSAHQAMPNH